MIDRRQLLGAALLGPVAGRLAAAAPAAAATPAIKALKPGEFLWYPQVSPIGPVVAIVSLPEQLMHVYRNGIEIGVSTCSTGMPGHTTPTGVFTILQKNEEHYSSIYKNAPMPFMQRLTWSGVAIHAGNLPGYPASHGCVRVPLKFSALLFEVTHVGSAVIIANEATAPGHVLQPGLFLPDSVASEAEAKMMKASRTADRGPHPRGNTPTSILVSGYDRRGYLFRNGRLAFSEPVRIRDPEVPLGNSLYAFMGLDETGSNIRWSAFGLKTAAGKRGVVTRATDDTLARLVVDDRERLLAIAATLSVGTTLVVTDFAASPETRSSPDFVVLKSESQADPAKKPKKKVAPAAGGSAGSAWQTSVRKN